MSTLPIMNKLLEKVKKEESSAAANNNVQEGTQKGQADLVRKILIEDGYYHPSMLSEKEKTEISKRFNEALDKELAAETSTRRPK